MSHKETESLTDRSADWDEWRAEIRAFYRRTVSEIQRVAESALARAAETPPAQETPPTSMPPVATTHTRNAYRNSDVSSGPTTPMEESQDRLANLKRQLAAKLNQSTANDDPSVGT